MQEKIKQCEVTQKDDISKSIGKKTNFLMILLISLWLLLCTLYYIFSNELHWKEIISQSIPSLMIPISIYIYFEKKILEVILTEDEYRHYQQKMFQCVQSDFKLGQKFYYFLEKYRKIIAILFLLMGFSSFFIAKSKFKKPLGQECKQTTNTFPNSQNNIIDEKIIPKKPNSLHFSRGVMPTSIQTNRHPLNPSLDGLQF